MRSDSPVMAGKICPYFVATTIAVYLLATASANSLSKARPSFNQDLISSKNLVAPNPNPCLKVKSSCPVPEKENATLLPNPDDCGSYCSCVWGNPEWMPCPSGLHFNPILKVCDWPNRAGCGTAPNPPTEEPDTTKAPAPTTNIPISDGCAKVKPLCPFPERENATLLPNPDDCGSYCACVWGTPILMRCPIGLYFNPSLNVCDWPNRAGCGGSPKPPTDAPETTKAQPTEVNPTTVPAPTTNIPISDGCAKVKPLCPVPERENATLLPNPDDCGSYCACVWGTPILMRCPIGLYFNPSLNVCDWPNRAGCGDSPKPPTDPPATTKAQPTEVIRTTVPAPTTNIPISDGCPKVKPLCPVPERENATLLPNPDDCGSYCACVWGTPILMRCPIGLYFNPSLNVCDWPNRAGCGGSPKPPTDAPETTKAQPTEVNPTTVPAPTTNIPISDGCAKVKPLCPVPERENATLLPNPDDCGSYCACVWGTPILMRCPIGLYFNPSLNVCDWPNRAGCGGSPKPPTDSPATTKAQPTEVIPTTVPAPTTNIPISDGCAKVKPLCPVPERENATLLPNPDDCGSYCACVWGTPILMRCPIGLYFNPSLNVCDWPNRAGCGGSPKPPTDAPETTKAKPTEVIPTTVPAPTTNIPISDGCAKVKPLCPVPERENATLLPNPDDCGSYCACVWGTPILMRCPIGLYFNPSLNVCDWPNRAGCGGSPKPPTDAPETTKAQPTEVIPTTVPAPTTNIPISDGCAKVKPLCPVPERENATLLPNPDDCGSYCACVWGTPILMRCPIGLYFNPSLNVCDWPNRAGCGGSPKPPTDPPATTKAQPTEVNPTTVPAPTTNLPISNGCSKVKHLCPVPEKENATLLPNPDDCGSYCECVWGNPVLMPCPAGLHFNPTLHVCDHPKDAGCGAVPNPPSDEPTPGPTNTPDWNDNTSSTSHPGTNGCFKVKPSCPVPEKVNATLLPNPDDCGSYCACSWGIPNWMPCPVGLHFNPELHVCDYPYRAGCISDRSENLIPA